MISQILFLFLFSGPQWWDVTKYIYSKWKYASLSRSLSTSKLYLSPLLHVYILLYIHVNMHILDMYIKYAFLFIYIIKYLMNLT